MVLLSAGVVVGGAYVGWIICAVGEGVGVIVGIGSRVGVGMRLGVGIVVGGVVCVGEGCLVGI